MYVKGAPYAAYTRMHAYMQSYPYVHNITRILDLRDIEKQDVNIKKKIEFQIK